MQRASGGGGLRAVGPRRGGGLGKPVPEQSVTARGSSPALLALTTPHWSAVEEREGTSEQTPGTH